MIIETLKIAFSFTPGFSPAKGAQKTT